MAGRPRKHHYVPRFYLAGFTKSGDENGKLYVLDQQQVKEWSVSPANAAKETDFYAVELGPGEDPNVMEDILARLEGHFSRVIANITQQKQLPDGDEFNWFLNFVALTVARLPRTRTLFTHVTDNFSKAQLREQLSTPDGWKQFKAVLEAHGRKVSDDEYEGFRRFAFSDNYTVNLDQTSQVQMMVHAVDPMLPLLAMRHWSLGVADESAPDFICSDAPVSLQPMKGSDKAAQISLDSPNTLLCFPITRRLVALATYERRSPILGVNDQGVAGFNAMTLTGARQLFSSDPDFTYLGHDKSILRKHDLIRLLRARGRP